MKTPTRSQILKIIGKSGKIRPSELRAALNISAQGVHYHLRNLVEAGLVEAKGSVPYTQYALAGIPDFEAATRWVDAKHLTENPTATVCETREVLAARLPRLKSFVGMGLRADLLPLVISTVGEIGNNSFDHNLGQWRDVPGCWFETQVTGKHLWICIADRGQGIFQSLTKVHPALTNPQAALEAAFERIISGRAPEQRGNGLKYVKKSITTTPGGGIACISGTGHVRYGEQGPRCMDVVSKDLDNVNGTITLMVWRME